MCISGKYPYSLMGGIGNSGEGWGSKKEQNYSVCMTENWNFLVLGVLLKIPSVVLVWMFSETMQRLICAFTVNTFLSFSGTLSKYCMPHPFNVHGFCLLHPFVHA